MIAALNHQLHERLKQRRMFVALLYAIIHPQARSIHLSSAGQVPPVLHRSDGLTEYLDVRGLPVGGLKDATYRTTEVKVASGDALVVVSDGVVEAESPAGEVYGFDRLLSVVASEGATYTAQHLLESILHNVEVFSESKEQLDDITVVVVRAR